MESILVLTWSMSWIRDVCVQDLSEAVHSGLDLGYYWSRVFGNVLETDRI
jgi:hypothetical protein